MAKQAKVRPAQRAQERDDSLLVRSAESLGRMIGTLQRQLDIVSKRTTAIDDTTEDATPHTRKKRATRRKRARNAAEPAARKTAAKKTTARKSPARKSSRRK